MESEKQKNDRVLTLIDQKIIEKQIDEQNETNTLFSKLENLQLTPSSILDEKINQLKEKKKNEALQEHGQNNSSEFIATPQIDKSIEVVKEEKQEQQEIKLETISNSDQQSKNFEEKVINEKNIDENINNQSEKQNKTIENIEEKQKNEYRKYILLAFVAIVFVLTFSWVVYNTVKIKEITQQISTTTETTKEKNVNIKRLISELNKLNSNEEIKDQATAMDPLTESVSSAEEYDLNTDEIYQGETNLYDKISNFFQKLFGG